jgi:uncharacterized membrane protein YqjE
MDRIERQGSRPPVTHEHNGRPPTTHSLDDASIGDLFRQLTSDASLLVQQEVHLAKTELKESISHVKTMAVWFALAAVFAIPGLLALAAFLVIGLGAVLGSYWASALIIGVVLMTGAVVLGRRALSLVKDGKIGLPRTKASLAEDATWGKEEIRAFKREMTA